MKMKKNKQKQTQKRHRNNNTPLLVRVKQPRVSDVLIQPGTSSNDSFNSIDNNLLSSWNFPVKILNYYLKKGISKFFDWQVECLQQPGVLNGRNLVYSAPTSAGKTMVSDVLLYKTLLEKHKKAIIILPFVSITVEKVLSLKSLLRRVGFRIDSFAGNTNPRGGLARVDVAVCTIEKANNMINKLIQEGNLSDIGIIIVDELHMIGDASRGYLLELLLTKVIYLQKTLKTNDLQIVGMSATIPNLPDVAKWLNAELYITNYRPVPLYERIVNENKLLDPKEPTDMEIGSIDVTNLGINTPDSSLVFSAIETLVDGFSALVFCSTRSQCESVSKVIAENIFEFGAKKKAHNDRTLELSAKVSQQIKFPKIYNLLQSLKRTSTGLDKNLELVVRFGVAFHHAGLSIEERALIENSFRDGTIRILCSTTTLSAGVNLPARRVLICSPFDYRGSLLDVITYQQMIGRAGRKNIDTLGESFLFCKQKDLNQSLTLVKSSLRPVKSKLIKYVNNNSQDVSNVDTGHESIQRAILEVIANETVSTFDDLKLYFSSTFFSQNTTEFDMCTMFESVIGELFTKNLINSKSNTELKTTPLGMAVIASGVSPQDGVFIFNELDKARRKLCLVNDLHLIYEVTPTYFVSQLDTIDWNNYMSIFSKLDKDTRSVAELIGVNESFLVSRVATWSYLKPSNVQLTIHLRFYASLALYDLVREIPLLTVVKKYHLSKGLVQSLQQQAATFAGMLTTFCSKLGWNSMELLIEQFQPRLSFGVQRDLIDLMRLPCINSTIARMLYNSGYELLTSLISCQANQIEQILLKSIPFSVEENQTTDSDRGLTTIYIANIDQNITIRDLSSLIIKESRSLVESDIGQKLTFTNDVLASPQSKPISVDNNVTIENIANVDDPERSFVQTSTPNKIANQSEAASARKMSNISQANAIASTSKSTSLSVMSFDDESLLENLSWSRIETEVGYDSGSNLSVEHSEPKKKVSISNLKIIKNQDDFLVGEDSFEDVLDDLIEKVDIPTESQQLVDSLENAVSQANPVDCSMTSPIPIVDDPSDLIDNGSSTEDLVKTNPNEDQIDDIVSSLADSDFNVLFESDSTNIDSEQSLKPPDTSMASSSNNECASPEMIHSDDSMFSIPTPSPKSLANEDSSLFDTTETTNSVDFSNEFFNERILSPVLYELNSTPSKLNVVRVMKTNDCQIMLKNIFGSNLSKCELAIHFTLKQVKRKPVAKIFLKKKNSIDEDLVTNGILLPKYNCHLTGIGLYHLGQDNLYYVPYGSAFDYLRDHLYQQLLNIDPIKEESWGLSQSGQRKLHFVVYDLKKAVTIFNAVFAFNINYMIYQIQWNDVSVALWLLNPKDNPFEVYDQCCPSLVQVILQYHLNYCDCLIHELWGEQVMHEDNLMLTISLFPLINGLLEKLYEQRLFRSYKLIEIPVRLCLFLIEHKGMLVDYAYLNQLKNKVLALMSNIESKIFKTVGSRINLSSTTQVSQVLYSQFNLLSNMFEVRKSAASSSKQPVRRKIKKPIGTSKLALIKLQEACGVRSKLPTMIIDWRKLNHLFTHSLNNIFYSCQQLNDDHRLAMVYGHCFEWTSTGRISMHEPNLINIERDFEIQTASKSIATKVFTDDSDADDDFDSDTPSNDQILLEPDECTTVMVRRLAIARNGFVLISADYCQLELRLLAHFSKDQCLLNFLNDDNNDVFKLIAAKWKNVPIEEVTYEWRQQAKQICYGVIYGMGDRTLAEKLAVDIEEAKEFKKSFFQSYDKLQPFMERSIDRCAELGYIETISGRRRPLPNIHSKNNVFYFEARRQVINSIIQGSAADILKFSLVAVEKMIIKERYNVSLLLQLHDELLYEVEDNCRTLFCKSLKQQMEFVSQNLQVNLPVKIHVGTNWSEMSEIDF